MDTCTKTVSGQHYFEKAFYINEHKSKEPSRDVQGHYKVGSMNSYVFSRIKAYARRCAACGLIDDVNCIEESID